MKKLLFVNGCIRGKMSRTLKLAKTYIDKINQNQDYEVVERNLTEEEISFYKKENFDVDTGLLIKNNQRFAVEFAESDEIVVAAPFWEFMFPAVVSSYFEMVSIVGVAFKYTDNGSVGLCKANSLTYIYTAGDFLKEEDKVNEKYLNRLSKLYGIPKFESIYADGLDIFTNNADEIVEKKCNEIKNK